jgi:hypothetical protein
LIFLCLGIFKHVICAFFDIERPVFLNCFRLIKWDAVRVLSNINLNAAVNFFAFVALLQFPIVGVVKVEVKPPTSSDKLALAVRYFGWLSLSGIFRSEMLVRVAPFALDISAQVAVQRNTRHGEDSHSAATTTLKNHSGAHDVFAHF